jgi:hypothetical protein
MHLPVGPTLSNSRVVLGEVYERVKSAYAGCITQLRIRLV